MVDLGEEERFTRAAMRPANPAPRGMRTPWATSSSIPCAAVAMSSRPVGSSRRMAAVSAWSGCADPAEQLVEQLVEAEVRQRRVRQELDAPEMILREDLLVTLRF